MMPDTDSRYRGRCLHAHIRKATHSTHVPHQTWAAEVMIAMHESACMRTTSSAAASGVQCVSSTRPDKILHDAAVNDPYWAESRQQQRTAEQRDS